MFWEVQKYCKNELPLFFIFFVWPSPCYQPYTCTLLALERKPKHCAPFTRSLQALQTDDRDPTAQLTLPSPGPKLARTKCQLGTWLSTAL